MLQYNVQVPPLSFSSPHRAPHTPGRDNADRLRSHDHSPSPHLSPLPRHMTSDSPSFPRLALPNHLPTNLSIATNFSSPSHSSPGLSPLQLPRPRSPYAFPRQLSASPVPFATSSPRLRLANLATDAPSSSGPHSSGPRSSRHYSWSSHSAMEDIFAPGDVIGEGVDLQGEPVRLVPLGDSHDDKLATEFEVVRKLGSGSYAVVYLVQEVVSRAVPSEDGHCAAAGRLDLDEVSVRTSTEYGRQYAIKCLSKANLDEEALAAQMSEVTIHQSLSTHPNLVTLHRTFETSAFLLLLLEYVPGEDLYYFLEQDRDHYETDPTPSSDALQLTRTPPTPSLLSSLKPSQLLSRTRLKLIAAMFNQMCEAVAACHDVQVYHRDIKPENFIVTDGWTVLPDGSRERKVIVKLSDFGLSTTDVDSADMDCGSAPYMSYECRNNIAPTYKPRAADVWSLGIVLINMLYHFNPWTDTTEGVCNSFDAYRKQPIPFFMQRFPGMTEAVAEFLSTKVFCLLPDSEDDSARIGARELGQWVREHLPTLLASPNGHKRVVSSTSIQGHPLSSCPNSRPASRHASTSSAARTPAMHVRSLSRAGLDHAFEVDGPELSTILDQELEPEEEEFQHVQNHERHPQTVLEVFHDQDQDHYHDQDQDQDEEAIESPSPSRCQSTTKRRKRGARKGKGTQQQQQLASPLPTTLLLSPPLSPISVDDTLNTLASASQSLARELSRSARSCPTSPISPPSMQSLIPPVPPMPPMPQEVIAAAPIVSPLAKKASKWKLSFGKSAAERAAAALAAGASTDDIARTDIAPAPAKALSATASNVTNLLMGLSAPPSSQPGAQPRRVPPAKPPSPVNMYPISMDLPLDRGRARRGAAHPAGGNAAAGASVPSLFGGASGVSAASERWAGGVERRAVSPTSARSGRVGAGGAQVASSASSTYSNNWRSSMSSTSSAATSTSAFTRYSNGSRQSVATVATSVSSGSWRQAAGSKPASVKSGAAGRAKSPLGDAANVNVVAPIPRNVKIMNGVPWELDELPRQMHPNPTGDIFGAPPVRKTRTRKVKSSTQLGTITERPSERASPVGKRTDAATSTTDLSAGGGGGGSADRPESPDGRGPKKVQKGQINTLAKMLSALRR